MVIAQIRDVDRILCLAISKFLLIWTRLELAANERGLG
jgi:hypothetical protein